MVESLILFSDEVVTSIKYDIIGMVNLDLAKSKNNMVFNTTLITLMEILLLSLSLLGIWIFVSKSIITPILNLKENAEELALGNVNIDIDVSSNDELGQLGQSFEDLVLKTRKLVSSAEKVGEGDFESSIEVRGKSDVLAKSLNIMKNNLRKLNEKSKSEIESRKQVSEIALSLQGIKNQSDLLYKASTELSTALGVGHAAFFLTGSNENSADDSCLKLVASYAYKERKNLSSKFKLGEGLVGQCALEKKTIILTDVPDDYIRISSALGEKEPRYIIVMPIAHEDKLLGVFEMAAFKEFTEEQQFVLNEVISTLAVLVHSVRAHEYTESLLEDSRAKGEELQTQQEELKAANEELEEKSKFQKEAEEELKAQSEEL